MPTQNTSRDCCPHLTNGRQMAACNPGASIGMNRATTMIKNRQMQETIGRQIGFVVRVKGLEENARKECLKLRQVRRQRHGRRKKQIDHSQKERTIRERTRKCSVSAPPNASHAPSTKRSCHANGLKYQTPDG